MNLSLKNCSVPLLFTSFIRKKYLINSYSVDTYAETSKYSFFLTIGVGFLKTSISAYTKI